MAIIHECQTCFYQDSDVYDEPCASCVDDNGECTLWCPAENPESNEKTVEIDYLVNRIESLENQIEVLTAKCKAYQTFILNIIESKEGEV